MVNAPTLPLLRALCMPHSLCSTGQCRDVADVVPPVPLSMDEATADAAVRACRRCGDAGAAWEAYMHASHHRITLGGGAAGELIEMLAECGEWKRAVEVRPACIAWTCTIVPDSC